MVAAIPGISLELLGLVDGIYNESKVRATFDGHDIQN